MVTIIAAGLLFLPPINWRERRSTMTWTFGFMLPVCTPQNAVVYGSGRIPITKMVRSGMVFDITGLTLLVLLVPLMATLIIA
jgi:di/tricarboxylate transporter